MTVLEHTEYRISDFQELEPQAQRQRLGRLLRQRGACLVSSQLPPGVLREARREIRQHQRSPGRLKKTPRQVAGAYFGEASARTLELSPPGAPAPQDEKALRGLDAALESLAVAVAEAAQLFLGRTVGFRACGLLHVPLQEAELAAAQDEDFPDDPDPVPDEDQDDLETIDAQEAWRHVLHCARKKVVMLFSFQPAMLQLESRTHAGKPLQLQARPGDVLIYLHDACFLRVLDSGPLLQVDLKIESSPGEPISQELVEVPKSLVEEYARLLDDLKELPSEEVALPALKDAHLQSLRGVRITSLKVELPSICLRGSGPAPLAACLVGGLDTVTETSTTPPPLLRRRAHERRFYGAKWDMDEYFSEEPSQDGSKMYCKHLSVLYRSCGLSDFDYRHFGLGPKEAAEMDPRCRLLLEGHEAALRSAGQRDALARPFGLFSALSSPWGLPARSNPSLIVGQVSECLNLTGPVMNLDTGDSSSLVAVEKAVASVRQAECEASLASSVRWIEGPREILALCHAGLVARSARTRAFDAAADGFVPGEGVVVCMLGSVQGAAGADYGSIVGAGTKFSGKAASLRTPHAPTVSDVLAKAARDGAPLCTLDAAEASAGGHASSDGAELALLRRALQHRDDRTPVVVSCAKASFGHAGLASGLVGLARSLLLLGRGLYGPQLHLRALAAEPPIEEAAGRRSLQIPTEVVAGRSAWQLLGVSSFASTGTYAHNIVLADPPTANSKGTRARDLLWWPQAVKKKERNILVHKGYFLQGTMTAWLEGMPMTRVSEEDEVDMFEGYIGLVGDYAEKFQIWVDDDPDKALHPPGRGEPAEAPVLGPAAAPRSLCWQLGEDGRGGDGYRIRLQMNGKLRRVSWTKLSQAVRTSLSWTIRPLSYSLLGDHSAWSFEAMVAEADGSFSAELQLLKALSSFQIFRDADFEQGLYPAQGAMEKAAGATKSADGAVELSGEDVLGPDNRGYGLNFQVAGEIGDLFRVVLQRHSGSTSVAWRKVGWRRVDFKEVAKSHVYYVAGSWDNFASCKEMQKDSRGNWSVEVLMQKGVETFQILLNRNWLAAVHPDASRAGSGDAFRVEGPDEAGHGKYFCLGASDSDTLESGLVAMIHLEIHEGFPSRVWWERSDSDRAHELRMSAGAARFAERHLRLMGLIPYDEETNQSPRTSGSPDWWNEGHVQVKLVEEKRAKELQATVDILQAMDSAEKQLDEKRKQLASLA